MSREDTTVFCSQKPGPKICLLTSGSRGDVQPFMALAQGMQNAGFNVTIVTHEPFRSFAEAIGLDFRSLGGDPRQVLNTPAGRELLESGDEFVPFFRKFVKLAEPFVVDVARSALNAVADADVLLCSSSMYFIGEALGEKLGCRVVFVSLQPMAPTREQPAVFESRWTPRWPFLIRRGWYRRIQILGLQLYAHLYRRICTRVRKEVLQLPARSRYFSPRVFSEGPLFLYGYSTHVVPRPTDWAETQQVCGYWITKPNANWRPDPKLEAFLSAGTPPVYIGFGSMPFDDPHAMHALIIEAVQRTGQRAVVSQGWGGLGEMGWPDSVHLIDDVPHEWLFPRMSAVVHHGGAGTTAASLRAGVPTIVVPFIADQPYWGRRVHSLGCGPVPIPRKQLTATNLAAAIQQATQDNDMRRTVQKLSEQLRAEDGVAVAVDHLSRELADVVVK